MANQQYFEIKLSFGAMSPSLKTQLQEIKVPEKTIARWQKMADSIIVLHLSGLINASQAHAARKKLVQKFIQPVLKDASAK